jgi:pimeloyl-ACP methyl ester carboxylesterase
MVPRCRIRYRHTGSPAHRLTKLHLCSSVFICGFLANVTTISLSINGVDLVVEDLGRGERPFVLVHGFTGFRDDFREQLPALTELGRTILYDHRGHGDSTNTGDATSYSFAQLVDDLGAVLDALNVQRCDLLGHSMGGMLALRFALAHPQRTASLVLMDTAARAPDHMPRAPLAAGGAIARSDGMATLAELLRRRAADEPGRPEAERRLEHEMGEAFWERRRRRLVAMDPEAFAVLALELVDHTPLTNPLSEISCPTLVMVGEQDIGFLAPADELARGIPRARKIVIPRAAHSPQIENPEAWIAAIRDHLTRVRGTK